MSIKGINFIDIETVSGNITEEKIKLFALKFQKEISEMIVEISRGKSADELLQSFFVQNEGLDDISRKISVDATLDVFKNKSALYAEFGQIICICIGRLSKDNNFYVQKITGDEKDILLKFYRTVSNYPGVLCAHNGSEFDFPYLMRKYMMHSLPMPSELSVIGKKPWDVPQEDTMKMWGGTAWNYKISLELLCHSLGVPSPKDALSGKMVGEFYAEAEDKKEAVNQIADYCAGDVIAMMNCYCRMKGFEAPAKGSIIVFE